MVAAQDGATADVARREFDALRKELGEAQRDYMRTYQARVDELRREQGEAAAVPAFSFDAVIAGFRPRFRAAAERFAGTDGALPFLQWLLGNGGDDSVRAEVLDTMLRDHMASAQLGGAVALIRFQTARLGDERVHGLLSRVLDESPHEAVRAAAALERAQLYLDRGDGPPATPEQRAAALADVRTAIELAGDDALAEKAKGVLFEQEHLQVGMQVPDIAGRDLDGAEFRLSDYRGKVVLLDFWGDW